MVTVNVHEAKTNLSRLLAQVEAGEEVVIARNGNPVARLVRVQRRGKRQFGSMKGRISDPTTASSNPFPERSLPPGRAGSLCGCCSIPMRSCGGPQEANGCRNLPARPSGMKRTMS